MKEKWDKTLVASCVLGLIGLVLWGAGKLAGIDVLFVPAVVLLGAWALIALANGFVLLARAFRGARWVR